MSPNGCIFCKRTNLSPEITIDSDLNCIPALKLLLDDELTAHWTIDKHHHTPIFGWFISRDINTKLSETHGLVHHSAFYCHWIPLFLPHTFSAFRLYIQQQQWIYFHQKSSFILSNTYRWPISYELSVPVNPFKHFVIGRLNIVLLPVHWKMIGVYW